MFARLYHCILLKLRIRKAVDWAGPELGPEVNHPYIPTPGAYVCCVHCGGGKHHAIHQLPWNARRTKEVLGDKWEEIAKSGALLGCLENEGSQAGALADFDAIWQRVQDECNRAEGA